LSPTLVAGPAGWYPGVRWPPSDIVPWPPSTAKSAGVIVPIYRPSTVTYPDLAWDASLFGLTVLAEFVQPAVVGMDWAAVTNSFPFFPPVPNVMAELDELQMLAEYRPEVLSEALSQTTDMVGFWAGLLMFSPYSHPHTFRLARTAIVVGEFLVMHYKRQFMRPRPSQLSPTLMPPIAVPGHASYPSGHATQAYLLSLIMADVMPDIVKTKFDKAPTAIALTPNDSLLDRLAERVARNREVLGLHYPSDSKAGQTLAGNAFTVLASCPAYQSTKTLALTEWT
jgi:membrane-associated phospholipid phosphatase